jgi:hypothetical protein
MSLVQYPYLPSSLQSLGAPCLGPRSLYRNAIVEYCPNKSRINFASATLCPKIALASGTGLLSLRTRCDWCYWERGRMNSLRHLGVLADDDQDPMCIVRNCPELRWERSSHCVKPFTCGLGRNNVRRKHGLNQKIRDVQRIQGPVGNRTNEIQISGDAWQCLPKFQVIQLLLNNLIDPQWTDGNGYRPKVLILDNEFFGLNLDAPVLQTSLLDFSTNEMLVDACIKHEPESFALKDRFGRRDLTAESISKTMARRPKAGRHVCTAYECGELVMKSGITPQDYILEWSNHPLDLPRLRRMLFKSGFQNVLPPDAHCVSLVPLFRPSILELSR